MQQLFVARTFRWYIIFIYFERKKEYVCQNKTRCNQDVARYAITIFTLFTVELSVRKKITKKRRSHTTLWMIFSFCFFIFVFCWVELSTQTKFKKKNHDCFRNSANKNALECTQFGFWFVEKANSFYLCTWYVNFEV